MTTVLAISPHLDDAVFSAGGLLRRLALRGCRVVVATVFTGNVAQPQGFALACQLDKGLGPEVDYMALRREEDCAACAILGVEYLHLPLLEAPHRGYVDAPALFGGVQTDDGAIDDVRQQLGRLLEKFQPRWVLGPLGIGSHVDHLVVRRAIEALQPARTMWWEDWPYALKHSRAAGDQRSAWLPLSMRTREAKFRACLAYASQLGFQFGGPGKLRQRLNQQSGERFMFGAVAAAIPTQNSATSQCVAL